MERVVPDISVVIPVYGCGSSLETLHGRLTAVLTDLTPNYEIILVDDRSPDGAWATIDALARRDAHVIGLRLSRNFGQHPAIAAGLARADGEWTVVMDCDLQDPPEAIRDLYARAQEGYDIVFARRTTRQTSAARRAASRAYFRLLNAFSGSDIDGTYGNLSMVSRKVVRAFLQLGDRDRHYLLVLGWLGFDHTAIEYELADRVEGRSAYTLSALITHAMNGVFFQTTRLLRWIVYLGFGIAASGVAMALAIIVARLFDRQAPGWTSLAVFILLVGGTIIVTTGVIGLYVGKVFDQVKGRPLFVIDEDTSTSSAEAPRALR